MRILVVEDNTKNINDAKIVTDNLVGCTVDFASSQEEALNLIAVNKYDTAILDVFYPAATGGSADSFANAIELSKTLTEAGIHHVFNTSGNHHGPQYQGFLHKTPVNLINPGKDGWDDGSSFMKAGQIIESYPEDAYGDLDTKQWIGAFRYVLLVQELLKTPDNGKEVIIGTREMIEKSGQRDNICQWYEFTFGDYGRITRLLEQAANLNDVIAGIFQKYNV